MKKNILKFCVLLMIFISSLLNAEDNTDRTACPCLIKTINNSMGSIVSPFVIYGKDYETIYFTKTKNDEGKPFDFSQSDLYYSTRIVNSLCRTTPCDNWSKPIRADWSIPSDESSRDYLKLINSSKGNIAQNEKSGDVIIAVEIATDKESIKNIDLFLVKLNNGVFSKIDCTPLRNINEPTYIDFQPTFSEDGNTLFFVSNRPASKKGLNIFYSERSDTGWTRPRMVSGINTDGDDVTPHCGTDGKFYYASNGLKGAGGMDIYVSDFNSSGLPDEPVNLDDALKNVSKCIRPCENYNTPADEAFPFLSKDKRHIYISSNRDGKNYKIYAFDMLKPAIRLNVYVYEEIIYENGTKSTKSERSPNAEILLVDVNGIQKQMATKNPIILDPNCQYTIKPILQNNSCIKCEVANPNEHSFNTGMPEDCEAEIDKEFTTSCKFSDTTLTINSTNYITGYWYPMTDNNFSKFKDRVTKNFFEESPYVDVSFNDFSIVVQTTENFQKVYDELTNFIERFGECLEKNNFTIRLSLLGYTDERGIRQSRETDKTQSIYPRDEVAASGIYPGDAMNGPQFGNLQLSKLRANFTGITIIDEMKRKSSKFADLYDKGLIYFESEGFGIAPNCKPGDDPASRRVDLFIDIGPNEWVKKTQRIIDGKIAFKQIQTTEKPKKQVETAQKQKEQFKRDIEPTKKISVPKIIAKVEKKEAKLLPEPFIKAPSKQCDCFSMQYTYTKLDDAKFAKDVLERFNQKYFKPNGKDALKIEENNNKNGKSTYRLYLDTCLVKRNEAINTSIIARKTTNEAARMLKRMWPNTCDTCNLYSVSFGAYKSKESAEKLMQSIQNISIQNVRIDPITLKDGVGGKVTYYRIRAGYFKTKEIGDKELLKFTKKLKQLEKKYKFYTKVLKEKDEYKYEIEK